MKRTLSLCLLSLLSVIAFAQKNYANDNAATIKRLMDLRHCSPPTDDAMIRQRILSNFVIGLDPSHMYFTQPDVDTIYSFEPELKETLRGRRSRFIDHVRELYMGRIERADSLTSFFLQKPFDYNKKETFPPHDTVFVKNTTELKTLWGHWLQYSCLRKLAVIAISDSGTHTKADPMKDEPTIRKALMKSTQSRIHRSRKTNEAFDAMLQEQLYDAICKAYDPHSDYFNSASKENFSKAVTGQGYFFGFSCEKNEREEVCISHLVPGSPAWSCGQINQGDVIVSLQWEGQPLIDLQDADIEEVIAILDEQNKKTLAIGIKKTDGTRTVVKLQKKKMEQEGTFVKSYILGGSIKVGYIVLPGFYTEEESKNGKSCANDVAREVVKLKAENVQGIILDLRNNGGGSLAEAMGLAGIFIDEGMLAFAKYNTGKPQGIRDPNRGTIYDGPLFVMVNKASASASEMVAAALQDYNRALLVGSPTFGKATIQIVLPADTNIDLEKYNSASNSSYSDFVKATIGRFYRVTGITHQLKGVQPDIHLPDLTEVAEYGESYMRYPLDPDTVKRATYFTPLAALPISELAAKSRARVQASADFAVINKFKTYMQDLRKFNKKPLPLRYAEYLALDSQYKVRSHELYKEYKSMAPESLYLSTNLAADADRIKLEHEYAEEYNKVKENINRDIYIRECFSILVDYLKLTKK